MREPISTIYAKEKNNKASSLFFELLSHEKEIFGVDI